MSRRVTRLNPPIGALMTYALSDPNELYVYLGRILRRDNDYHVFWPISELERNWHLGMFGRPWYQTKSIDHWKIIMGINEDQQQ